VERHSRHGSVKSAALLSKALRTFTGAVFQGGYGHKRTTWGDQGQGVENGRKMLALRVGHPQVARPQGTEEKGMEGPGKTLGGP
jgi:hypothetical protein